MKKNCIITLIVYFFFTIIFSSCIEGFEKDSKSLEIIKNYWKISLPNGVSSFNSAFGCLDNSYEKPCIFFVSFLISKRNFSNWIKEAELQQGGDSMVSPFIKDQKLANKIKSIELRDFAKASSYKWWKPFECRNPILYPYLYNSQSKKIVRSIGDYWDGRVLIMYCEEKAICYFIVETFL
jgi:hypothetical protein